MQVAEKLTLTSDAPGKSLFMLGNEAIARGAIEAGVQVFAAYPGTPSSEISETLINLSKELRISTPNGRSMRRWPSKWPSALPCAASGP